MPLQKVDNGEELSNSFLQLGESMQNSFFQSAFENPPPEKFLLDSLLKELRNYLKERKTYLNEVDTNEIPQTLNNIYQYLLEQFVEFCDKHKIVGNLRRLCWDNIRNDFRVIETISLNKYQDANKKKIQKRKIFFKKQEIIRKLNDLTILIPSSANECINIIIYQSHYVDLIPVLESQKNDFEREIMIQITDLRYIVDKEMMDIIDRDVKKMSNIINNFIDCIIKIMKRKKTKESIKQVLKFCSIIGIIVNAFTNTNDTNDIDLEDLDKLGVKSFRIVDTFIDDVFPNQNTNDLIIPKFTEKNYVQLYQNKFCH